MSDELQLNDPRTLYRRWEESQWSPFAVDLTTDQEQWAELAEEQRGLIHFVLSSLMVAEERITTKFSGLVAAHGSEEEATFLATQQVDEARHMQFYARFQDEVVASPAEITTHVERARARCQTRSGSSSTWRSCEAHEQLVAEPGDLTAKVRFVTLYHQVLEGTLGLTSFKFITDYLKDNGLLPGFVEGYSKIHHDETRHIGYGVWFLREAVRAAPRTGGHGARDSARAAASRRRVAEAARRRRRRVAARRLRGRPARFRARRADAPAVDDRRAARIRLCLTGRVMAHVLFVCLHNAGRSQMSRALFEQAADGRHTADCAGSEADPHGQVHPQVVEAMRELGIDLSGRRPQPLTHELAEEADVVVTMGCGDACPYIPGKRYVDWDLPDPKGQPLDVVRALREEIKRRVPPTDSTPAGRLSVPVVPRASARPPRSPGPPPPRAWRPGRAGSATPRGR